jgi:hypothetical protein
MGLKISEHFGGAFLTGEDLKGGTYQLQLGDVRIENFDDGEKLVLAFQNAKKCLVLNKTNGSALASVLGDDTECWFGAWVEAFTIPVTYSGRVYQGIRLRVVSPPPIPAPPRPAATTDWNGQHHNEAAAPVGVPASQTRRALQTAHENGDDIPF